MASKAKTTKKTTISSSVAKHDDGTIQITFTIPFDTLSKARDKAVETIGKEIEVPGFRKGKAPLDEVKERIPQNTLIEQTLRDILPNELAIVFAKEKIRPAIYPKLELIKSEEKKPWEVRATTCELPVIDLGDYKKNVVGAAKASAIWTPEKGDKSKKPEKTELSKAEKEQKVLEGLVKEVKVKIPKLLIDEEVNNKLSNLLSRIEKLGLKLESYLASIGKTPDSIRGDYEKQAKDSLIIDMSLLEIANKEKVSVSETEVKEALESAKADPNFKEGDLEEQRSVIKSILTRRAALDKLVALM